MSSPPASSHPRRDLAETLLIAAGGGALFGLFGLPAGWLSGAIVAVVTATTVFGRPMVVPARMAQVVFVVLGISLGQAVTPETLGYVAAWPASLAALLVAMTVVTAAIAVYLRRVHGWDTLSALFAAAPGALSQVLAHAVDAGADIRAIAIVQSMRVLVLSVALPLGLAAAGITGEPIPRPQPALGWAAWLGEVGAAAAVCTAVAIAAFRLRIPGGLIVGAMVASGVLHGSGAIHAGLPAAVTTASFVALGAMIGARFAGTDIRTLAGFAGPALGAFLVGTTVACAFAVAAATLLSLRVGDVVVAYAPGGLEVMTILAFALHLDPAFVGVHHLARFVFVSLAMPVAVRRLAIARIVHSGDEKVPVRQPSDGD